MAMNGITDVKNKSLKTSKMEILDEGDKKTSNWGTQHAGKQEPGQSASGGNSSGRFAEGGKNSMYPRGHSIGAKPGQPASN
jgi:hypothetical protein